MARLPLILSLARVMASSSTNPKPFPFSAPFMMLPTTNELGYRSPLNAVLFMAFPFGKGDVRLSALHSCPDW